jgi:biopolymer transport protein ExbD
MAELDTSQQNKKKGGKKKRSKKFSTRIDLTPMVDLGFLLVTFFMLTTTFSKPQTMEINMPVKPKDNQVSQENANAVKASKALTIILGSDNKVYWYRGLSDTEDLPTLTDFSKDGIRRVLLDMNMTIKDMVVLIKPSNDAKYRNVVDILDEMNITNIKRYALVDITNEDLKLIENL